MAGTQAGLPELVTALRIAIVGCGDISQRYGRTLAPHETVEIAGATDLLPERAKLFVDEFGGGGSHSFGELLGGADVAVYPLTILTAIFGPARRVTASGKVLMPDRTTPTGESFEVTTPDFAVAYIEWDDGTVARVTANFYVTYFSRQQGSIEFHGDEASLYLASWTNFDSKLERAPYGGRYEPVELAKEPFAGCEWGRGVAEMAEAIENGRPHRATGEQAAHVVEIASSIYASIRDQRPVELSTTFTPPAPMDWAV